MNNTSTKTTESYHGKRKAKFIKHYNKVLALAKRNGKIILPRNDASTRVLANFLDNQKRRKYLPNDEREMLAQLKPFGYDIEEGFNREHDASWDKSFQMLVEHKESVGHLRVSKINPTTRPLSRWVNQQRQLYRDNKLSEDRKRRLLDIGFTFICAKCYNKKKRFTPDQDEKWHKMFVKLCQYKEEHGHCDVPFTYQHDPELANWVSVQRSVFHDGKMDGSRRSHLDGIGFTWRVNVKERAQKLKHDETTAVL